MKVPDTPKFSGLHRRCVRRIGELGPIHQFIALVFGVVVLLLALDLVFHVVGLVK